MGLVRKSIQISRAMKSASRFKDILSVLSRHGFGDVIERMGLGGYLPRRVLKWADADSGKNLGERMRLAFEELGPTFVKLGQVLSMRPDLIPEQVIDELVKLQDDVQPLPFQTIREVVESELKCPIQNVFSMFKETPLASASIGQVHHARLKTGEDVVVKVLRPEIRKIIERDINLMTLMADLLEKYFPELRVLNPKVFVEEFFKTLKYELDFNIEANNIVKTEKNLAEFEGVVIPKVFRQYSTEKVLVLEKLEGIRLNDKETIARSNIDKKKIAEIGARAFLYSVLKYGFFHGDLHGGNLFILPGDKLGIIDFGIVGRLSQKSRDQLATMVWSLLQEDYETLCYTYADLGSSDTSIDFDSFQREVRNVLSPYLGLSLDEVNTGRVLIEATKVAAKYNIRVPGDWMQVFRAIVTMEGMGRMLDPDFDMMSMGETLIKDLISIQTSPSRLKNEVFKMSKDVIALLDVLPRNIRWGLRKLARNDYAIEFKSPELARINTQIDRGSRRISRALASTGLMIAGAILMHSDKGPQWGDYPAGGVVLVVLGVYFAMRPGK